MARTKALGMGMDALFSENGTENSQPQNLKLTEIFPNKSQPRRDFDDKALEALADSIKQHGVLQPILVRPLSSGGYRIVAGERRWRASRLAGLEEIPVYIRELSDIQAAQVALVENLQREDLNPIEEALGYKALMEQTGCTQDDVAKAVGKSRPAIANSLRLLGLDRKILEFIKNGELSSGHARALLATEDPKLREEIAKKAIREGLTVRQVEELVKKESAEPKKKPEKKRRESIYHEVELSIKETAGRVCSVKEKRGGGGTLSVEFYDKDDLMAIARLFEQLRGAEEK